jgi:hypothetical protein
MKVDEAVEPNSARSEIERQERDQWRTLDGCPITPGPWSVRAATFCDDGIPSFEVVMPGEPRMSAVDARLIGAAPALFQAAKKAANELSVMLALNPARDGGLYREALDALNAALALINVPESAKRPISDHRNDGQAS